MPTESAIDQQEVSGIGEEVTSGSLKAIGKNEIEEAVNILQKYKEGKSNLESRIVENEQWYKLRHWDIVRGGANTDGKRAAGDDRPEPTSAWLFNSLANKHADAMDNYPEPNVLPREQSDEKDADVLSSIIPVILERNNFEGTYSNGWWYKLKHGTTPYGVFWDNSLENGLGDINIKELDILNLFWESGITDIQDSRNLFIVALADTDLLEEQYPQLKGKLGGKVIDVKEYVYDDTVDTSDKSVVVDWYYKKAVGNKTVLHYCKFVAGEVLFASENEPENYPNGWYEHGEYPIVFDVLFPEAGTPYGFGYLSIMKDPQMYIDKLSQVVLENTIMGAKPRYFAKNGMGVNEEEFLDWSKPIVHVEGQISDERLVPITMPSLPSGVLDVLQMKIDELKETSSNRDFSQGSSSGGVTAAAAIAALQEAGNKTSRDMIAASYRSYTKLNHLIIELIRQFYDENRSFRIIGKQGAFEYIQYSNDRIQGVPLDPAFAGQQLDPNYQEATRVPVFDVVIKPQKRSAYSRMAQNELAKELYGLGLFEPERAEPAMTCLDMMEFDGDDKVRQKVQEGQTLLNVVQQLSAQLQQQNMLIAQLTGQALPMQPIQGGRQVQPQRQASHDTQAAAQKNAQTANMTNYGERLASRAKTDMNRGAGA
ncbi:MAG: hypothetical protein IJN43_13740 [Ruminococcus sp.]|nr:hypothetical protein [Ruminococcus sp.]